LGFENGLPFENVVSAVLEAEVGGTAVEFEAGGLSFSAPQKGFDVVVDGGDIDVVVFALFGEDGLVVAVGVNGKIGATSGFAVDFENAGEVVFSRRANLEVVVAFAAADILAGFSVHSGKQVGGGLSEVELNSSGNQYMVAREFEFVLPVGLFDIGFEAEHKEMLLFGGGF